MVIKKKLVMVIPLEVKVKLMVNPMVMVHPERMTVVRPERMMVMPQ